MTSIFLGNGSVAVCLNDLASVSTLPGITDAQSTMEVMVDARRGKLLKSLRKVWLQPLRHTFTQLDVVCMAQQPVQLMVHLAPSSRKASGMHACGSLTGT